MDAARILKDARRRAGLSQHALAAKTGIPQPMISAIERGQQDPRLGTLDRLLRASGHEVDLVTLAGKGVDRGQLEGMLRFTPEQRLAAVPGNTKLLRELAGARDARGRRLHHQMVAPVLHATDILQLLVAREVRFVVVGGIAGNMHGSAMITNDLDICYKRDRANLHALAGALRELGATLRNAPADLPFRLDAETLERGLNFTFVTKLGWFDIIGEAAGEFTYDNLLPNATSFDIGGSVVPVVSLDELIRMKRAAGRPKDRYGVANLTALRDVKEGRPEEP